MIEKELSPVPVKRVNFPYRRAGKPFPDRTPVLLESVRKEVFAAAKKWGVATDQIAIGGRSMGGRMCSMVASGEECELLPVGGLILISYPLHPPGKPEQLRAAHLSQIRVPTLLIHGTRDPFGSPEELRKYAGKLRGKKKFHFIDGGRHELKNKDEEIAIVIKSWTSALR
jgi:uncharacterized protein